MTESFKTDFLSTSTIKKVMPSCLVYAFVQSMTFMVDTVLAGSFLEPDAVAAVAVGMPIIGLMISFSAMIMHGGYLMMLHSLGRSDMEGYNRIFSLILFFTIAVDLVFIGICFGATNFLAGISGGAKATEKVFEYGCLYIRTACLMILFFAIGSFFQLVCASFGYQTERLISSVINVVGNILVSILAINLLSEDYKIAGLGIGSAFGAFFQMISAFGFMLYRKVKVKFSFYAPDKRNFSILLECVHIGLPASIDGILDSASGSVVNNVILSSFANGSYVLALVAMIKTVFTLVRTVGSGILYASEALIGILHGERDNGGICSTFKTSLKLGFLYATVFALIIICFQQPILNFYELKNVADAKNGLILIALSGLLLILPFMMNSAYESTNHHLFAFLVASIPDSILYPLFVAAFGRKFGVTAVWISMGFSFVPFIIVYYSIFAIANRRLIVPLERFLLLEKYENRKTALDVSIPANAVNISFVSEYLQNFFLKNNTPAKLAYISALCMEEIAADYIAHRSNTKKAEKETYMDIKAFRDEDKIEIILRNYDEPYDPLIVEDKGAEDNFSKIGIVMTQKIASEIHYSYAYHLNVVTVIIPL